MNIKKQDDILEIANFINKFGTRLKVEFCENDDVRITQGVDGKSITLKKDMVNDLLHRDDSNGKPFIQINFVNGNKILVTDMLIGFKPYPMEGLDLSILPGVVTTQDLYNVFEALESAISEASGEAEVRTLKRVFDSIIQGGEAVGFDLNPEKCWPHGLAYTKASA